MKQIKYSYIIIFLLPFSYALDLVNLHKLDAESPTLKTREDRSPHYSSGFFSGYNGFPYGGGGNQGSHENHQELDCPFPYIRVGENCFYAKCTNGTSDILTWNAARIYCQTSIPGGGDLAVFDSANEFADAVRYIRSLDPNQAFTCDYWIGGYDIVNTATTPTTNIWTWINGKRMSLGVPFWDQVGGSPPPSPPALLPTISNTVQEAYLRENGNYFFNQADGTTAQFFPLCQISLETRRSGHGGSSHEEQNHGFFNNFPPILRTASQDTLYPQLRLINPFQNPYLRSSQVAPSNPFIRSFGHNSLKHSHHMPYVMNPQQRNLPIPGMFSARKAEPNVLNQQIMIDNENRDNHSPPESNYSLLDKTISLETEEEKLLQSATINDKLINDQQAAEELKQERAKESKSETLEVQKEVSTVDNDPGMLERKTAADDLKNESEPDDNANIEIGEPGSQVKEEFAEPEIQVKEEFAEPGIQVKEEFAEPGIQVKEEFVEPGSQVKEEFAEPEIQVNEEFAEPGIQVKEEFAEPGIQVKEEFTEPGIQVKEELAEPGIQVKEEFAEPEIQVIEDFAEPGIQVKEDFAEPEIQVREEFAEPEIQVREEFAEPGIQVKEEFAEVNLPVNEEKVKSNEQEEAIINIPVNEVELSKQDTDILIDGQAEEFRKQKIQMKTSSADTDQADANFYDETKLEIDNEPEISEGKRSEFQSDPLNSYLPGMIYDIVNILQNIDRTYKPKFTIDRTEDFSP